jgi:hypothetical protein
VEFSIGFKHSMMQSSDKPQIDAVICTSGNSQKIMNNTRLITLLLAGGKMQDSTAIVDIIHDRK